MTLPGSATIPAADARRHHVAEAAGRRAVELATDGPAAAQILTAAAFDNAITVLMALGGSTNAVVHLLALARRVGHRAAARPLRRDRAPHAGARERAPVGRAPVRESRSRRRRARAAQGARAAARRSTRSPSPATRSASRSPAPRTGDTSVLRPYGDPIADRGRHRRPPRQPRPDGAIIKRSAASARLLRHRGPALVFEDIYDVAARIDDAVAAGRRATGARAPQLRPEGRAGDARVGPAPDPGEAAQARRGRHGADLGRAHERHRVRDGRAPRLARVSRRRAAARRPRRRPDRARRRGGRLDLDLPQEEIDRRLRDTPLPPPKYTRGYGALFLEHVLQAHEGWTSTCSRARPRTTAHRRSGSCAAGSAAGDGGGSPPPGATMSERIAAVHATTVELPAAVHARDRGLPDRLAAVRGRRGRDRRAATAASRSRSRAACRSPPR